MKWKNGGLTNIFAGKNHHRLITRNWGVSMSDQFFKRS
jgi:hypothetical protein